MKERIDLNADLGEDPEALDRDRTLMTLISSCNIACGGHAGDEQSMRAMLRAAAEAGVSAGAHPSYPDRAGFGRVSLTMDADGLAASLIGQVGALDALAREEGVPLTHIKPHGALYNDLAAQPALADAVAQRLTQAFPALALVGLAHGAFADAVAKQGQRFIAEGFIDRRYTADRRLTPRTLAGAVIADESERIDQALRLASGRPVTASDGSSVRIEAQSLCIHSDSPGAIDSARTVRQALQDAGFEVASP